MLTDPVGAARQGGNGSTNAYRYPGEYGYYRDGAALQYVRARWLTVGTGRWLNAKAANRQRGSNPFAYGHIEANGKVHLLDGLDIPVCAIPCEPCWARLIDAFLVSRSCKLDLKCWARCLLGVWRNLPAWVKIGCGIACGACVFCLTEDVCGASLALASPRRPRHPGNSHCNTRKVACNALCSKCADPLCCGRSFGACCHEFCTTSFHRCLDGETCNKMDCLYPSVDFTAGKLCEKSVMVIWTI